MRGIALFIVAVAVFPAFAPAAQAAPGGAIVTAGFTFLPGDDDISQTTLRIRAGSSLQYANLEPVLASHTVTSVATTVDGSRLFDSGPVATGATRDVAGVSQLPPGTYPFFCQPHQDNMTGTLEIF